MRQAATLVALCWFGVSPAWAQSGINFGPESGPQVARGGAWVARADSPLATYYNPAALTRQESSVLFGGHMMSLDRCLTRFDTTGAVMGAGGGLPVPGSSNGPPLSTCQSKSPYFNGQVGATFPVSDRMHVGLVVVGPHAVGKIRWPETVSGPGGVQPAGNRFQLVNDDSVLAFPTISVGYAVTDRLSIGAGFVAAFFSETATLYGEGLSPPPAAGLQPRDDFFAHQEIKLFLEAQDRFIPEVVFGMFWSPRPTIDVGAWYKHTSTVRAEIDLRLESRAWAANGQPNTRPCGPTEPADCNVTAPPGVDGWAIETLPPELHGGVRYHRPRNAAASSSGDSLIDDLFDIEVDVAWANNSIVKQATLDLGPSGGTIIRGVSGGVSTLPDEAGVTKNWQDVISLRGGGEYVVRPGRLALQAGAFFENSGQDARDLHVHFDLARKAGVSGGATFRLARRIDLSVAVQRMIWADLDNGGAGGSGGLSGDVAADHETLQFVNGGRLTSKMTEAAAWLMFRF